jgi:hypothetical protein
MTKNVIKITAGQKFCMFFISKIAIYLSLVLQKGRPSYRRSLQPSKMKIQMPSALKREHPARLKNCMVTFWKTISRHTKYGTSLPSLVNKGMS